MKLPNADKGIVDREKIVDYLLNPAHADNGGMAGFFLSLGFSRKHWSALAAAFRRKAEAIEVAKSMESPHGRKYIVEGRLETPGDRRPWVRTVWIVDAGQDLPRLVTAYPREE